MTIQHNTITDPDIHEPKGVASAASGKVYIADGAGSGDWDFPITNIDTALEGQAFISDGAGSGTWTYPPAKGHAEIYIDAGATAITLNSASQYSKLNPSGEWTASGFEDVLTVDATNGEIVLGLAGHYKINFWINFSTSALSSGTAYNFKFAIDGVTNSRTLTVTKPTNGTDILFINACGLLSATAGQKLSIYVGGDGTSSSTNITPINAGLVALHLD